MKEDWISLIARTFAQRVPKEEWKNYTFVFPMRRAGLFLKDRLQQIALQFDRPVFSPDYKTIDELVGDICGLQSVDEIEAICTLHTIYTQYTEQSLPLDIFYGWGQQLLQDFSNIDASLVDARTLFNNSIEAKKLEELDIDESVRERLEGLFGSTDKNYHTRIRDEYRNIWSNMLSIYTDFNNALRERGQAYPGAKIRYVVEHFDDIEWGNRKFVFVGFNYLLRGEKKLFELLKDRSLFFWDYDPSFTTNSTAYTFIEEHIQHGLTNASPDEEPRHGKQDINLIITAGSYVQAQYVHQWLQGKKGKTAIVIADEAMLEPVIYALPKQEQAHYNITKGYPLRLTNVYAQIIAYLTDPQKDKHDPQQTLREMMETLLGAPIKNEDGEQQATSWQELLKQEAVYQARKVIERLLFLLASKRVMLDSYKTLRLLVRRMLDGVNLPFHGEPVTDIQIIGVLETRLLDFEHVLILNVEEGVLPKTSRDMSFIPYYLRKYYRLETNDESAAAYAYNFFRLLRRASDVTCMFSQATTGMGQNSMSRFLMQILTSEDYHVHKIHLTESALTNADSSSNTPLPATWQSVIGDRTSLNVSPSAISTFLRCRRSFYYQYVLGWRLPESPSMLMPTNILGSLTHATIQNAYVTIAKTLPNKIEKSAIEEFLSQPSKLQDALVKAYASLPRDPLYLINEHPLENQVVLEQVKRVLTYDMDITPFTLISMEQEYRMDINVRIGEEQTTIRCKVGGFVDRLDQIDLNGEKRMRIVDFKTGRYDDKKMNIKLAQNLFLPPELNKDKPDYVRQTLIYALAVRKERSIQSPIMPALYFTTSPLSEHSPYVSLENAIISDATEWETTIIKGLEQILFTMLTTEDFALCDENSCRILSCPFKELCKRN